MYTVDTPFGKIVIGQSEDLFSPAHPDRGTLAMLSCVSFHPGQRALDLGCGCGLVGLYAAMLLGQENVVMCDIDPKAVEAARENARLNGLEICAYVSDGVSSVPQSDFDLILTNPPYQSDFSVAKRFIEKGFNRLKIGGCMYMVTKRRAWYENKLRAIFGGVKIKQVDGYFVFEAERRRSAYANARTLLK